MKKICVPSISNGEFHTLLEIHTHTRTDIHLPIGRYSAFEWHIKEPVQLVAIFSIGKSHLVVLPYKTKCTAEKFGKHRLFTFPHRPIKPA